MTFMPNHSSFNESRAVQTPIRRPRLLIAAARAGQAGWRRERGLRGLLGLEQSSLPGPRILPLLRFEEEALDQARRQRAADYNLQRHILFLIAILAEETALAAETAMTAAPPARLSARETASRAPL